jgi:hypothetical protein
MRLRGATAGVKVSELLNIGAMHLELVRIERKSRLAVRQWFQNFHWLRWWRRVYNWLRNNLGACWLLRLRLRCLPRGHPALHIFGLCLAYWSNWCYRRLVGETQPTIESFRNIFRNLVGIDFTVGTDIPPELCIGFGV